jgi:hypothetical protein
MGLKATGSQITRKKLNRNQLKQNITHNKDAAGGQPDRKYSFTQNRKTTATREGA